MSEIVDCKMTKMSTVCNANECGRHRTVCSADFQKRDAIFAGATVSLFTTEITSAQQNLSQLFCLELR